LNELQSMATFRWKMTMKKKLEAAIAEVVFCL
jgi:hypothetical protein